MSTRDAIHALTGLEPIVPPEQISQMCAIPLPRNVVPEDLKEALFSRYRIEVPVHALNGIPYLRISLQGYNDASDANELVEALGEILA
ncbi:MAG: hypothetical protein IPK19_33710 [Chloroflexi bacterium]|nr:hypothetical protein [Chloroflexota bacterium]